MNDLTIIIPTHFRNAMLTKCLEGLVVQTAAPREIIIVDDGNGNALEVFHHYTEKIPLKYIHSDFVGPVAARNLAIDRVTTEFVAFLDDDCIPSPDFCKKSIETFLKFPEIQAQSGRILWAEPEQNSNSAKYFISRYRQHIFDSRHIMFTDNTFMGQMIKKFGYQIKGLPGISTHFSGSNAAIRMDLLRKIGGFNQEFRTLSDREMAYRIIQNKGIICYNPEMIVNHAHDYSFLRSLKRCVLAVPYEKRLKTLYPHIDFPGYANGKRSGKSQLVPILIRLNYKEKLYQTAFKIIHKIAYMLPLKNSKNPLASKHPAEVTTK